MEEPGNRRISHVTRRLQDLGLTAHAARHIASYPEPLRTLAAAHIVKEWPSIRHTGPTAQEVLVKADEQAQKCDEALKGVFLPPSPLDSPSPRGSLSDWLEIAGLLKEGVPLEWAQAFLYEQ